MSQSIKISLYISVCMSLGACIYANWLAFKRCQTYEDCMCLIIAPKYDYYLNTKLNMLCKLNCEKCVCV